MRKRSPVLSCPTEPTERRERRERVSVDRAVARSTPYALAQDARLVRAADKPEPRRALPPQALAWERRRKRRPTMKTPALFKMVVFKEGERRGSSAAKTTRGNHLSRVHSALALTRQRSARSLLELTGQPAP